MPGLLVIALFLLVLAIKVTALFLGWNYILVELIDGIHEMSFLQAAGVLGCLIALSFTFNYKREG